MAATCDVISRKTFPFASIELLTPFGSRQSLELFIPPEMQRPRSKSLVGRDAVESRRVGGCRRDDIRRKASSSFSIKRRLFLSPSALYIGGSSLPIREFIGRYCEPGTWPIAGLLGAYMIMPDHIHLFCSPTHEECVIEPWITFWKREFRREVWCGRPETTATTVFIIG